MNVIEMSTPPEMPFAPTDDRRRDSRRPAPSTTAHLSGKSVIVTDLSLHGLGFYSDEPLVVGHLYGLAIQGNWINLSSRIRIVACRGGLVGAEFC